MKYYIFSWKWSQKGDTLTFWNPNKAGYTANLNNAGIYSEEEVCSQMVIVYSREELKKFTSDKKYEDWSFLIPVNHVEDILGKTARVIFR